MNTKRLMSVVCFALITLGAGYAKADTCDERVVDETGTLGSSGLAKVTQAADKLAAAGADVRVRVVGSLQGQGNMDLLFQSVLQHCPSWQAPGGGKKNNLQVTMLMPVKKPDGSFGAKVGLYHGDQWTRALGSLGDSTIVTNIIKNDMAPPVRDGRYADGIVAGLTAVTARIEGQVANPVPTAPVQQAPAQPPVVVHEQPTDLTGLWYVLGGLGVLGALVLLVIMIGKIASGRGRRRAAQQKAMTAKISCASYVTELDTPLALFEASISQAAQTVSEEDLAGQRAKLRQAKSDLDSANQRFGELNSSVTNPDIGGKSEQEYDTMAAAYEEALTRFRSVKTTAENGRAECGELSKLPGEAKAAVDALSAEIDTSLKAVEGVKAQGFGVEPYETMLAEAERFYDQAGAAMGRKQFTSSKSLSAKGKASADKARTEAEALPDRKVAIDRSIVALETKVPGVKSAIQAAKAVADEIVANFAPSCFESVSGNGVEAIKRFESAAASVATAKTAASMEQQKWSEAEQTVASANKWLDDAVSLMRSVTALKASLEKAKQDAPGEVASAQAEIEKARAFIRGNADDINDPLEFGLIKELDQAERDGQSARAELRKPKPDYLQAVKQALSVHKTADKVLASAQEDQQATVRQRRMAEQAVSQAEASVSKAKEYIEDHTSVGPYTAQERLESAQTLLASAKKTTDLGQRIELAGQAEEKADSALSSAKSAVKKAKEAQSYDFGRSSGSSGSSGSDAFLGGLIGGAIGSSIGSSSSSSHSHSSSSSSDSIFGGGGGSSDIGGFGGGGGGGSFDIGGGGGGGGGGSSDI